MKGLKTPRTSALIKLPEKAQSIQKATKEGSAGKDLNSCGEVGFLGKLWKQVGKTGIPNIKSDRKAPAQPECGIWRRPRAAAGAELRGELAGRNPAVCVGIFCKHPRARQTRCVPLPCQPRQPRRGTGEGVGEGLRRGTCELATQFPPLFFFFPCHRVVFLFFSHCWPKKSGN